MENATAQDSVFDAAPNARERTAKGGFTCSMPQGGAAPVRRRSGCLFGFLGGCLTSLLVILALPAVLAALLVWLIPKADVTQNPVIGRAVRGYTWLRGAEAGETTVLRLELSGVIGAESDFWNRGPDSSDRVLEAIESAVDDGTVNALLLVINSPGGTITASDELYHALMRFREADETRRIFVLARDIMASGAYYAALPADWIRLQPTSVVGSVGVIIPGVNLSGLTDRLGIRDNSVASGAFKDLSNPLRPVNPEHNAVLKQVVDTMHTRFVRLIARHRKLGLEDVAKVADGRIFDAEDAVNRRLADDVGYEDSYDALIADRLGCEPEALEVVQPAAYGLPAWQRILLQAPERFARALTAPLTESAPSIPQYRY